jgi:hypothetical protein
LFIAWALVGGAYAVSLIGILTIGIFVLPIAVIGTVMVTRRPSAKQGVVGLLAGLGLPPLYVAFLNRGGPDAGGCVQSNGGEICSGSSQIQQLNPWPWLAVGVLLITVSIVVFLVVSSHRK